MTTPQDPDRDPDPQNPYGTPPPPPIPPASNVYGTEPPPPPPYGQPAPPPQPAYGAPQFGAPGEAEPGKGMAIGALIASILGCTCIGILVAVPLAIVVLLRSRDGRNHGKGLAIAALVLSVLWVVGLGVGGYALYDWGKDLKSVSELEAGDCVTADGLTDADAEEVSTIRTVPCSDPHDGEVLATVELTAEQAEAFSETPIEEVCLPAIEAAGKSGVLVEGIDFTALTEVNPEAGDDAACIAFNADGSDLEGRLSG